MSTVMQGHVNLACPLQPLAARPSPLYQSVLTVFTICVASLAWLAGPALAQQQKPNNILVLWGDDIGWYNVSVYNIGVMGYLRPSNDKSMPWVS